jgi:hypothetical protein
VNGRWLIGGALAAAIALPVAYLALGGGDYEPSPVADPCAPREWTAPEGVEDAAEQFSLSALDGAACELGVSRETLAVALATPEAREQFAAEYGIEDDELESAVRAGVVGALSPIVAAGLRAVSSRIPVDEAIALIGDARAVFEDADGALGGLLDQVGGLLP